MSRTKGFRDLASYPLQTSYDTSIFNFGRETSIIWRIAALRYSRIPMSCSIYQNYFLFHLFGQGLHHWGLEIFNFVSYDPPITTRILQGKEVYVKISVLPITEWARRHAKGWCEPAIYPGNGCWEAWTMFFTWQAKALSVCSRTKCLLLSSSRNVSTSHKHNHAHNRTIFFFQ